MAFTGKGKEKLFLNDDLSEEHTILAFNLDRIDPFGHRSQINGFGEFSGRGNFLLGNGYSKGVINGYIQVRKGVPIDFDVKQTVVRVRENLYSQIICFTDSDR